MAKLMVTTCAQGAIKNGRWYNALEDASCLRRCWHRNNCSWPLCLRRGRMCSVGKAHLMGENSLLDLFAFGRQAADTDSKLVRLNRPLWDV